MWEVDLLFQACSQIVEYVPVIFRASGIVTLFAYCWALNIRVFDSYDIPFRKYLGFRNSDAQYDDVISAVQRLLLVLVVSYTCYEVSVAYQLDAGRAVAEIMFWIALGYQCLFSYHVVFRSFRAFIVERAVVLYQSKEVRFIDVLFADVLTSMSKLLADMQFVLCSVVYLLYSDPSSARVSCMSSIVGPFLASIPYAIRSWQCLVAYNRTRSRWQLVNFGKYMSSFPVIWISALKHHMGDGMLLDEHDQHLQELWLYAVILNTLYSFAWDVVMDWGLDGSSVRYPLLRDDLRFGNALWYYLAIVLDLLLRLCWSLKLSSHLQRVASGQAFVFLFEVLEVFRRFVWIYFRVEWEVVKEEKEKGSDIPSLNADVQLEH
jgi:hypothetical protein